jgi:hypothetical protein
LSFDQLVICNLSVKMFQVQFFNRLVLKCFPLLSQQQDQGLQQRSGQAGLSPPQQGAEVRQVRAFNGALAQASEVGASADGRVCSVD